MDPRVPVLVLFVMQCVENASSAGISLAKQDAYTLSSISFSLATCVCVAIDSMVCSMKP